MLSAFVMNANVQGHDSAGRSAACFPFCIGIINKSMDLGIGVLAHFKICLRLAVSV